MYWENYGIKINGVNLINLCFANDMILFSSSMAELQSMQEQLNDESKKAGLKINWKRYKL